jgi:flagellar basal body-associated protein FliL
MKEKFKNMKKKKLIGLVCLIALLGVSGALTYAWFVSGVGPANLTTQAARIHLINDTTATTANIGNISDYLGRALPGEYVQAGEATITNDSTREALARVSNDMVGYLNVNDSLYNILNDKKLNTMFGLTKKSSYTDILTNFLDVIGVDTNDLEPVFSMVTDGGSNYDTAANFGINGKINKDTNSRIKASAMYIKCDASLRTALAGISGTTVNDAIMAYWVANMGTFMSDLQLYHDYLVMGTLASEIFDSGIGHFYSVLDDIGNQIGGDIASQLGVPTNPDVVGASGDHYFYLAVPTDNASPSMPQSTDIGAYVVPKTVSIPMGFYIPAGLGGFNQDLSTNIGSTDYWDVMQNYNTSDTSVLQNSGKTTQFGISYNWWSEMLGDWLGLGDTIDPATGMPFSDLQLTQCMTINEQESVFTDNVQVLAIQATAKAVMDIFKDDNSVDATNTDGSVVYPASFSQAESYGGTLTGSLLGAFGITDTTGVLVAPGLLTDY